ncbi:Na(+)/H(+) exchange regulatory cofactor NHE-RF1a isoform X1 [Pangasianodon hypophthalmus]|uniref:Na(+)/H(+) exchange regulatory cofactor NHE-RF1a isoform X1 n=1 Tax=Pangasianodon hypophthalmus TaxID=310915 RepID=UPI002307E58A|nr:Na(+)/H(+) exchange regulatory cofactor NHE-RF1a isoform X1 [Pangasianodon hypophthalmus]
MSGELRPRLCVLEKGSDGYGFHLHGEKNKAGQFIRLVEPGSPAELSGLRAGDRLTFVNGESVEGESHQQVVSRIRAVAGPLELIVVDHETAEYLRKHNLPCRKEFVSDGVPTPGEQPDTAARERNGTSTASESSPVPVPDPDPVPVPASVPASVPVAAANGDMDLDTLSLSSKESKNELRPRLCLMKKGATGYGFNLHSEKSKSGQYIRAVDEDSPAEKSGLRPQDKVVQVNGLPVQGLQHSEVVAAIKAGGDELRLLVVDPDTEAFFSSCQVLPTEEHLTGPLPEPAASSDTDEKVKEEEVKEAKPASASPTPSNASSTASIPAEMASSPPSQQEKAVEKSASENAVSSLDLNISLQQAKERAHQKRSNKRAPPMDWSKRSEVFSNL